jgi:hypothetical protein
MNQEEGLTLLDCLGYDVPTKTPFMNYVISTSNGLIGNGGIANLPPGTTSTINV